MDYGKIAYTGLENAQRRITLLEKNTGSAGGGTGGGNGQYIKLTGNPGFLQTAASPTAFTEKFTARTGPAGAMCSISVSGAVQAVTIDVKSRGVRVFCEKANITSSTVTLNYYFDFDFYTRSGVNDLTITVKGTANVNFWTYSFYVFAPGAAKITDYTPVYLNTLGDTVTTLQGSNIVSYARATSFRERTVVRSNAVWFSAFDMTGGSTGYAYADSNYNLYLSGATSPFYTNAGPFATAFCSTWQIYSNLYIKDGELYYFGLYNNVVCYFAKVAMPAAPVMVRATATDDLSSFIVKAADGMIYLLRTKQYSREIEKAIAICKGDNAASVDNSSHISVYVTRGQEVYEYKYTKWEDTLTNTEGALVSFCDLYMKRSSIELEMSGSRINVYPL